MASILKPVILIVEDEALIRMAAADVLADAGLATLEAGNAEEALTVIQEHPEIELVFTDVNMPGRMDGLDLALRVHRMRPRVAIVVTSGKQRLSDASIPSDGAFLPKPYRANDLISVVGRQLRKAA